MRNIPINLGGYRLQVTEAPEMKVRKGDNGKDEVVTDANGVTKFVVGLFAKKRQESGERREKGEEIRVTLDSDPGHEVNDGELVELIDPRVTPYSMKNERGETVSGVAFAARGLKPVT
ncbi:hypothetical protein [Qaidamihabitans albus]|uniref:hypothetical protein n=1 Tax=Qaidamihabitans albus TaxID=2795733 RepID=UPI0018F151B6|nr:hypothetical protein [Qaidamihabitans albus]